MKYSYSKNINYNFDETEHKVKNALMEVGFGVLTEINMKDAFKAKLNLEYKNYKILGACNPDLAYQALDSEKLVGILMPCNILIIDNEDGTTQIVFPYAKGLLEITENSDILKLSDVVDDLLKKAFDQID